MIASRLQSPWSSRARGSFPWKRRRAWWLVLQNKTTMAGFLAGLQQVCVFLAFLRQRLCNLRMSRGNLRAGSTVAPVQHSKVPLPQTSLTVQVPSLLRMLCKFQVVAESGVLRWHEPDADENTIRRHVENKSGYNTMSGLSSIESLPR